MVFSKPKLYEVHAFDATRPYTFKFSYTGSQAEWNELRIDNANGETVYKQRVTSRLSSHKIPANTLTNNKNSRYKVYVTVGASQTVETPVYGTDSEGNQIIVSTNKVTEEVSSVESDWIAFYCFDSPVFKLNGLSNEQVINSSTLIFTTTYVTTENSDQLNSYEVSLYNANGQPIRSSGTLYAGGAVEFEYELTGLEDNQKYYVEVTGETLNHLVATTERIIFSVEYINPSFFAKLSLTNLPNEGQIKLQSNIVSILGKCGPTSRTGVLDDRTPAMPIYINDEDDDVSGEEIDITGEGHWVMFDESFDISGDFTMQIIMRDANPYTDILTMYHGDPLISVPLEDDVATEDIIENDPMLTNVYDGVYVDEVAQIPTVTDENTGEEQPCNVITLRYMLGDFVIPDDSEQSYTDAPIYEKAYISLRADNGVLAYTTQSNLIDVPNENTYLHIWIQRLHGFYLVKVATGNGGVD